MADARTAERVRVVDIIERYGKCVELVSMDPNFHDISVSLYVKDGISTVWTFSRKPGVETRIETIRDQLVALGGFTAVRRTHDQIRFVCGHDHAMPVKFLIRQAVEKDPSYAHPEGAVKDLRSNLMLRAGAAEVDGRWVYSVDGDGEARNKDARLRAVTAGLVRYGGMEKVDDTQVVFSCGSRHDELVRLLLPYARNVRGVEDQLETDALRGQMTTGTLGFTPPT